MNLGYLSFHLHWCNRSEASTVVRFHPLKKPSIIQNPEHQTRSERSAKNGLWPGFDWGETSPLQVTSVFWCLPHKNTVPGLKWQIALLQKVSKSQVWRASAVPTCKRLMERLRCDLFFWGGGTVKQILISGWRHWCSNLIQFVDVPIFGMFL